ncbi:MAG: heavy metal translocating P-type ATPase, partial [Burkholderiaceae bacterium]|nr:heavy metal translocating P-type ATPase [Burkholderiaceae bacterium]
MTCASCVARIEKALGALPGVTRAVVNLAAERADVSFAGRPDPAAIARAIEGAGYAVATENTELAIEGMTCASCVGRVEKSLARVPGVLGAAVNLATEKAQVRHLAPVVTEGTADPEAERRARELQSLRRAVLAAAMLTLPVFALEMASHFVPGVHDWVMATIGQRESWLLQFALATVVLFGPGLRFFRK